MPNAVALFFELNQVATGYRTSLSRKPSDEEWMDIYLWAEKQALLGVCFRGVELLAQGGQLPPKPLLLKWLGKKELIRRGNARQVQEVQEVCKRLKADGFAPCIVKGQSLMAVYPEPLRGLRQCGDIDVLVADEDAKVLRYAYLQEGEKMEWGYKHVHLAILQSTNVDLHYRLAMSRNLWRNRRIQQWCQRLKEGGLLHDEQGRGYATLHEEDNVVFLLLHAFWHFLFEGIGLRQMMDLYYVVHAIGQADVSERLRTLGLTKFASACSWLMWHVFEGECPTSRLLADHAVLPRPNEKEGRFLVAEVLASGNFGQWDERMHIKEGDAAWVKLLKKAVHYTRLARNYPMEFLWLPVGSAYIRMWRWWMGRKVYG